MTHCKHFSTNHCRRPMTAGYLTKRLKTTSHNQATLNHNRKKKLNKDPSEPLICQSSHHILCCLSGSYVRCYHFTALRSNQHGNKELNNTLLKMANNILQYFTSILHFATVKLFSACSNSAITDSKQRR